MKITPDESIWMAGYAARNRPSEGVLADIWAKALTLEDGEGNKSVLITMDLIAMRGDYMANRIRERLKTNYGLSGPQIILSCSHTHTGPEVMRDPADELYEENLTGQHSSEQREKIRNYSVNLEDKIVELVGNALESSEPVRLFSGQGIARFAVNRRLYRSKNTVNELSSALEGPVDHSVPVIKVQKNTGEIMAVVFGYACHNTTLGIYEISGDYAGFAQTELEKEYPGATALFFAGAGGDQNPLPRGTVSYAKQYGKELSAAVEAVLSEPMKELSPELKYSWSETELGYANPTPTEEELVKMIEVKTEPDYLLYHAKVYLQKLRQGKTLPETYSYPVQFWRIGEQNMVILGSEVVMDYAVRLKQLFGKDLFVMAYANEVIGYIPSARILGEGDYEGTRSYIFTTPWAADIEEKIIDEVIKVAEKTGVKVSE